MAQLGKGDSMSSLLSLHRRAIFAASITALAITVMLTGWSYLFAAQTPLQATLIQNYFSLRDLSASEHIFFFRANSAPSFPDIVLWMSDGTISGTRHFEPGLGESQELSPMVVKGQIVTSCIKCPTPGLYRTDGTITGTSLLRKGTARHFGRLPAAALYRFEAENGAPAEIWRTDGTSLGTTRITTTTENPIWFRADAASLVYFTLAHNIGLGSFVELWRTDGTLTGTAHLRDIPWGGNISMVATGDRLFMADGRQLWTSDGTISGTTRVISLELNTQTGYDIQNLVVTDNGTAFFSYNSELWRSDGTSQGTIRLSEPSRIYAAGASDWAIAVSDKLYFTGSDTAGNRELWTSDGTVTGTMLVKDLTAEPDIGSDVRELTRVGDSVVFGASSNTTNATLWLSDGTADGTIPLAVLPSIDGGGDPTYYVPNSIVASGQYLLAVDTTAQLWSIPISAIKSASTPLVQQRYLPLTVH